MFAESGLESIAFPSTLKEIPKNTFYACNDLRDVQFAGGLEKIGICAFRVTAIEQVILPASIRTIAAGAFYECKDLRTVKFCEGLEVLGTDER